MITGRDIVKIALNLVVIYVIGGVLLTVMYAYTAPIIFRNGIKAKSEALAKIMPEADTIEKIGEWKIHDHTADYYAAKKDSSLCGYLIESYGKGYSGYIHVLLAVESDFTVKRLSILSHTETPGLGDEIESEAFRGQFAGKAAAAMVVIKGPTKENIQAISGATISTRAVTEDAVKNALEFLMAPSGKSPSTQEEGQGNER
ncbi:MAG: RnfABCDGE type electron transport complex subunit G [Chitinispirillaceae bacterium]|nr:RnfABCDGE type electron transport complex subunit G [Chitinispirillaceae bacterium]